MIDPASTVAQPENKAVVRAKVLAIGEQCVTIGVAGTDYNIRLVTNEPLQTEVGEIALGTICAKGRRVDRIKAGGGYVEPVAGVPRRVQGRVVRVDQADNAIVLRAGAVRLVVTLTNPQQNAALFATDDMVTMDVYDGASFEPAR